MVQKVQASKESFIGAEFVEVVSLTADIALRGSSMIVIGGMFYFVPSIAALRLCLRPHEVYNMGLMAYDVCKLSFLIGKGVICRLI